MVDTTHMDFDAAIEAVEEVTYTVHGKTHALPKQLPHKAALLLEGWMRERGASKDVEVEDFTVLARAIFGDDKVEEWLEADMGTVQLGQMVEWSLSHLRLPTPDRGDAGTDGDDPGDDPGKG